MKYEEMWFYEELLEVPQWLEYNESAALAL